MEQIAGYIDKNGEITNYRAQLLTSKSDVSVKKYFAKLVEIGILRVEGKITNSDYQEINNISRQMATNELQTLTNLFKLFINSGFGAGSYYELVNQ